MNLVVDAVDDHCGRFHALENSGHVGVQLGATIRPEVRIPILGPEYNVDENVGQRLRHRRITLLRPFRA